MKKANYIEYMKLFNRLYYGVALTEERLSDNVLNIFTYLRDHGAGKLMNEIGISLRMTMVNCKPVKHEFIYSKGENAGKRLEINEIRNIGLLLLKYWNEIE